MDKLQKYLFYLTLFLSGAVILIIEIAGTRILSPFYGSTIYVWSSLITVTLACLALGYYLGGKLADKKPEFRTLYSIIFLAGLVTILIPKIDAWILLSSYGLGMIWGPLIATTLLFSLPLFLLAMVTPLAVKLKAKGLEQLGLTTGSLYAISTVGSLVGALLTGFWLIPNFGVSLILNSAAIALVLVVLAWWVIKKKFFRLFFSLILIAILIAVPVYQISSNSQVKVVYQTPSFYGNIAVVDKDSQRYLLIDGISQNGVNQNSKQSILFYTDYIYLSMLLTPNPSKALFFGLGAGIVPNDFKKLGIESDIVEIDPKIEKIAVDFFDFSAQDYNLYFTDARYFIKNTKNKYDVIVIDALNGAPVPAHLLSQQAFEEIKEKLTENGTLSLNITGFLDSQLIKSIYLTLKQVYPEVLVFAADLNEWTNIVFFASSNLPTDLTSIIEQRCEDQDCLGLYQYILANELAEVRVDQKAKIITDDYNPADFWQLEGNWAFRQWAGEFFGQALFTS